MGDAYPLVVIGGGLSGLAAGIRAARFGHKVLIVEKHQKAGGLNSYYRRRGMLFETGLHAMTNFAPPGDRHAPLNRLFRQLKLPRKKIVTHEQFSSRVVFPDGVSLSFSNDFNCLSDEVARLFPHAIDRFRQLVSLVDRYDPFTPRPFVSTREQLTDRLGDELLCNMLLWPLMMYGNSVEHDMDFSQFVIMFRAVFQEGFFRPDGNIKDFLDYLLAHYRALGGEIRFDAGVESFMMKDGMVRGLCLEDGEEILCDFVVSTAGYPATLGFMGVKDRELVSPYEGRVSFMEIIYLLARPVPPGLSSGNTIIFYNLSKPFAYCRPSQPVETMSGVICFPDNFQGVASGDTMQLRITHPANYDLWQQADREQYRAMKEEWQGESQRVTAEIIGNYKQNIIYQDSFTPLTIERYTGKRQGAVYGSPVKIKDGVTGSPNLFVAGTDQGYLGIVGSMLSGVTMVNNHILGKI